MPDRPTLVTVPNVELIEVGTWATSTGVFTWDVADLESAIDAQADPAIRTPILKVGHTDPRFDGEPSIGRIENLRLSDDRMTLLGDLTGVPSWLADVMGSAFPSRSIEGEFFTESQTGTKHRFVLTGLALLGVASPAIATLADVAALYGIDPQTVAATAQASLKEPHMPRTVTVDAAVSLDQVRQAFYADESATARFGAWAWVREVYTDHVIVDDDEGHLFEVPWSANGDAPSFDFEKAKAVKVEYVEVTSVAASADGVLRRGGLRERLAHMAAAPPQTPAATADGSEKGAGMDPAKLREALGLSADASDTEVQAALATAGVIPKATEEEHVEPVTEAPTPTPTETAPSAEQVAASTHVSVPKTGYDELLANATAGAKAAVKLHEQERETFLDSVKAKFLPANRDNWRAEYDKDAKATKDYFAKAADIVPLVPGGYSATDADETGEFDHLFPPTAQEG